MASMLLPLWRYADFQGRSLRGEVAAFGVGLILLWLLAAGFALAAHVAHERGVADIEFVAIGGLFAGVFGALLIVPTIALLVRRLHDLNLSGWWLLVALVPYLGQAALLVALCRAGTRGRNRFGPDPRGRLFVPGRVG